MSRAYITLRSKAERERAIKWISQAPTGTRVEFKEARRTVEQNSKFWAMLTEVATQLAWHGNKLTPDEWRFVFLDALKRETRTVPSIDGTGMVDIGRSSSNLSKNEFCDLIEIMQAFGAEHGVIFTDPFAEVTNAA